MDLKELLNYRTECLIHKGHKLNPFNYGNNVSFIEIMNNGLLCNFHQPPLLAGLEYSFNFNHTFSGPNNRGSEVIITMACDICSKDITAYRGMTVLSEIRVTNYYYDIQLTLDFDKKSFTSNLLNEAVKYIDSNRFYHVNLYPADNKTLCKIGSIDPKISLDDMLKGLLTLELSNFDMTKIKNTEQLISKMNFITLYS